MAWTAASMTGYIGVTAVCRPATITTMSARCPGFNGVWLRGTGRIMRVGGSFHGARGGEGVVHHDPIAVAIHGDSSYMAARRSWLTIDAVDGGQISREAAEPGVRRG